MKPIIQALIWTIPMWLIIIGVAIFLIIGFAVDPYATPYTDASIIKLIAVITSPFLITWLIGIATIYILGYIKKGKIERARATNNYSPE